MITRSVHGMEDEYPRWYRLHRGYLVRMPRVLAAKRYEAEEDALVGGSPPRRTTWPSPISSETRQQS
jgi:hypothetical protein